MSKRLNAAQTFLTIFSEQAEGPFADVYFDSSARSAPLKSDVPQNTYKAATFAWSGTERLELFKLQFADENGQVAPVEAGDIQSNTEEFVLNGSTCQAVDTGVILTDDELPFFARVTFPAQNATALSIERLSRFQPLATNLRITLETDRGDSVCIYDKSERETALKNELSSLAQPIKAPKVVRLILPALLDCVNLRTEASRRSCFRIRARLGMEFFSAFGGMLNEKFLPARQLEFGQHGVSHSFRYWSDDEKQSLIDSYCELVQAYEAAGFSSMSCFGFLLGMVRDDGFIPHDDDIDLVVFNHDTQVSNLHLMTLTIGIAAQAGFEVIKISFDQRFARLKTKNNQDLDVFICNVEDDKCFVYPSRSPFSKKETIFPLEHKDVFNRKLPFPRDPEALLADIYGEDWRIPVPYFVHKW